MAKAEGGQDVTAMTDGQMFEELIKIHAQSAGEAISSILRADIEIGGPRLQEMSIKDVEYGILEPAIFVKSCLTSQVAGNIVLVLRQRDMQVFLNELMGVDDLPDPDFVFDDVAMSAAGELMNRCPMPPHRPWLSIWATPWICQTASWCSLTEARTWLLSSGSQRTQRLWLSATP